MSRSVLRKALNEEDDPFAVPESACVIKVLAAQKSQVPPVRRLRTFAFDPSIGWQLDTAVLNETTLKVPWEIDLQSGEDLLKPGPVGEYIEVVDYDPASGCFYEPVDLDDPYILAEDGLQPSEGSPQFHQQMVYAVAMVTIRNVERALGRVALWASRIIKVNGKRRVEFVRRLRIYPHALREGNAFYSPSKKALLFGYFPASVSDPGRNLPGGTVFTCLSHDIVAHETTHALLDGLHRHFREPSNQDVLAFHEAFADIVALFQHFSYPESVKHQIARTRGDLSKQNLLGELAQQFGQALGHYAALRDAIGHTDTETHEWRPADPDPGDYQSVREAHDRGAILVGAVFDIFLTIYRTRIADLVRMATAGTGVLPAGEIHPDLVESMAAEANKSSRHVLNMCIRALDYCPPVDLTFGDYLRALITADQELVPDDTRGYRVAVVEAFRRRGIYPQDVRTLSGDSLRWKVPRRDSLPGLPELLKRLSLRWDLKTPRETIWRIGRHNCRLVSEWLKSDTVPSRYARELGLSLGPPPFPTFRTTNGRAALHVHSVRPTRRIAPDGQAITNLVIEITQRRRELLVRKDPELGGFTFRGGCTLLIDLTTRHIRFAVVKDILGERRLRREREFRSSPQEESLRATYFGSGLTGNRREPFALLHRDKQDLL